jgi:formylglycine-generating enzyme required for sulfatase activity
MKYLFIFWLPCVVSAWLQAGKPANPDLVFVSGGYFLQGDTLGNAGEKPIRKTRIRDFYIDKTELNLAQFQEFIQTSGYQTDAERREGSYIWCSLGWVKKAGVSWRHDEKGNLRPPTATEYPVMHVSWRDAAHYCNWLSVRQNLQPGYTFRDARNAQ